MTMTTKNGGVTSTRAPDARREATGRRPRAADRRELTATLGDLAECGRPATARPSRSTAGVGTIAAAVAHHVRALRLARGWSLDQLSARSGVSKGMVVQIEGARTNPSIGTLLRIADAFGIAIAGLLEPTAERVVRVSASGAAPLLWRGGYGGFARLLAGVHRPEPVELWQWRLQPHDDYPGADQTPGARALVHALAGEVTVTVEGADHRVRAGETIDFVADRTHRYRNDGDDTAELIGVMIMPGLPERGGRG